MANNSFGNIFRITTWGESHGKAIGVIVDGCPAGLPITEEEINQALVQRAPGKNLYISPRKEPDRAEILSGTFQGVTTGAPISLLIYNKDVDSSKYEPIKDILRPGHANFTYLEKYGVYDYRGGGRSSARETACRVAAGAIAMKFLEKNGIKLAAYIRQIGPIRVSMEVNKLSDWKLAIEESPIFCPEKLVEEKMKSFLEEVIKKGDSVGGIVEFLAVSVPIGLGDPVYEKLEAKLASAMMSLPASKGFEIGQGFASALMHGSEYNDLFINKKMMETNNAGGTLGGISNGMPLKGAVAFKPASTIKIEQESYTVSGEKIILKIPEGSKHDPCVAIRAVPVVKAMVALVLADSILSNRCTKA